METTEPAAMLPARTTPTWEIELLISGVAVFAMLQLPGWLDDAMFALEPRFGDSWRTVLLMFYFYAKSAAVVLALTFALHLVLRAQWVALMGMHSVYPAGINLDNLRMGPIQREVESETVETVEQAIERADNRATVVFAIGVTIAIILVCVAALICTSLVLITGVFDLAGWHFRPVNFFIALFIAFMAPFFLMAALDGAVGARLDPAGTPRRRIATMFRWYAKYGMGRRNNTIVALLTSNGGERRTMAVVLGGMILAIVCVTATYMANKRQALIGDYALFPAAALPRIDPAHYDDQRTPSRDRATPYVQSLTITGPYLKLVVPYLPIRDEKGMRGCSLPAGESAADRGRRGLECLASLRSVTLDDKPLTDLAYEVASDPRTDRPAVLAMIDVRSLPRGRHELRIARPSRSGRNADTDSPDPGFDAIPF